MLNPVVERRQADACGLHSILAIGSYAQVLADGLDQFRRAARLGHGVIRSALVPVAFS